MIKHLSQWIAQRVSWLRQQFSTTSRNLAKLHRATAIFVKVFPEHLENMFWDLSKLSTLALTRFKKPRIVQLCKCHQVSRFCLPTCLRFKTTCRLNGREKPRGPSAQIPSESLGTERFTKHHHPQPHMGESCSWGRMDKNLNQKFSHEGHSLLLILKAFVIGKRLQGGNLRSR